MVPSTLTVPSASPVDRQDSSARFTEDRAISHFQRAQGCELYHTLLLPMAKRFGLAETDVFRHFMRYNLNINCESNETYQVLGTQFALMVNYLPLDTWFSLRLDAYMLFVTDFDNILDVGFGLPFAWLLACRGLGPIEAHFTLLDSSRSALDVANEFIIQTERSYPRETAGLRHTLEFGSIEQSDTWSRDNVDAIAALDSIEHADQPSTSLAAIVNRYRGGAFFIGLPVGTPIPQHTIDFETEEKAISFVSDSGLTVKTTDLIRAEWDYDVVGNPGFRGSVFIKAE